MMSMQLLFNSYKMFQSWKNACHWVEKSFKFLVTLIRVGSVLQCEAPIKLKDFCLIEVQKKRRLR